MLSAFLLALREGVEIALILSIVLGTLKKLSRANPLSGCLGWCNQRWSSKRHDRVHTASVGCFVEWGNRSDI